MGFVMNLCDYLYVLDFGILIAKGLPDEVRSDPIVMDAYLGKEA
jgi:branched-chain amino acid transport system ATP-binding protein